MGKKESALDKVETKSVDNMNYVTVPKRTLDLDNHNIISKKFLTAVEEPSYFVSIGWILYNWDDMSGKNPIVVDKNAPVADETLLYSNVKAA